MQNESTRVRLTFRTDEQILSMIESHMKTCNCQSKNEFIELAIRWYCAKLDVEVNDGIVTPEMTKAINATVQAQVNRIAKMIFKESVSISMIARFVATLADCDDVDFDRLRAKAVQDVRSTNGSINIRDAVYDQQEADE